MLIALGTSLVVAASVGAVTLLGEASGGGSDEPGRRGGLPDAIAPLDTGSARWVAGIVVIGGCHRPSERDPQGHDSNKPAHWRLRLQRVRRRLPERPADGGGCR